MFQLACAVFRWRVFATPKQKVTRFRDMADHKADRKPRVHFRPERGGNLVRSFSEQFSRAAAFDCTRPGISMLACLAPDLPADPPAAAARTARLKFASIRCRFGFSSAYTTSTSRPEGYVRNSPLCHCLCRPFSKSSENLRERNLPRTVTPRLCFLTPPATGLPPRSMTSHRTQRAHAILDELPLSMSPCQPRRRRMTVSPVGLGPGAATDSHQAMRYVVNRLR